MMTQSSELKVVWSNAICCTVDFIAEDGLTIYGRKTFEQVKHERPDAELLAHDEALLRLRDTCSLSHAEIMQKCVDSAK